MLLLSTSSLRWHGIHKIFMLVKKAGYDGLDLMIDENQFDTLDDKYLKWLSDAFQIPVLSITAPEKWLSKAKIDRIVEVATTLRSQIINFSPPHAGDKGADTFPRYLNKIKKDLRISITLQNIQQEYMLFIIPKYKNANIGELKKVTGDTALNIANVDMSAGIDLTKMQNILGSSLKNIYLSDKHGMKDGLLPGNAWWGTSHMPLESFLAKLRVAGYNGFFSLRVKPSELWAGNEEKILTNLEQIKKYFNKRFTDYSED